MFLLVGDTFGFYPKNLISAPSVVFTTQSTCGNAVYYSRVNNGPLNEKADS